jgi:hypothetical protein
VRRTYHTFLGGAAVGLGGLAAVIVVHGGWQAVAAAVAIFGGLVYLLSLTCLAAASERPRATRPEWATEAPRPRRAPASRPDPETAAVRRRRESTGRAPSARVSSAPS